MDTLNHTLIDIIIRSRHEGRVPVRSSGLEFTAEHHAQQNDSFQVFAKRLYASDMTLSSGRRGFVIEQTAGDEVLTNANDIATNIAGEALTDIFDPDLIYIKTPVEMELESIIFDGALTEPWETGEPQFFPTYLSAGAVCLVTSPQTKTITETMAGISFSVLAADITAYEAATGQTFYVDFIYSARGSV